MKKKYPRETLVSILKLHARNTPNKRAYLFLENGEQETDFLTYKELNEKAHTLAILLQNKKLAHKRILLVYSSGLDFIIAFMGCLYAGAIAVPAPTPLNTQFDKRSSLLLAIAENAAVSEILTSSSLFSQVKQELLTYTSEKHITVVEKDNLSIDDVKKTRLLKKKEKITHFQYTSGSTTVPKAVVTSHNELVVSLKNTIEAWKYTRHSVTLTWSPHSHVYGLICGLLTPLFRGSLGIIIPTNVVVQKPLFWLKAITKYKVSHSGCPNFGYELCVQKLKLSTLEKIDLSSWKVAINGGEPIREKTLKEFTQLFKSHGFQAKSFCPAYGMSETTGLITSIKTKDAFQVFRKKTSDAYLLDIINVGFPVSDIFIEIVNPLTKKEVDSEEIGEIWLRGKTISTGYWKLPNENRKTFSAKIKNKKKSYFRTGDLGFMKEGELFITGRLKDLIIIYGKNYYPQDIENTIYQKNTQTNYNYKNIVFSVEKDKNEVIILIHEINEKFSNEKLNQFVKNLRQVISEKYGLDFYEIVLVSANSLPKTSAGKLQRALCQQLWQEKKLNIIKRYVKTDSTVLPEQNQPLLAKRNVSVNEYIKNEVINILSTELKIKPSDFCMSDYLSQYGFDSISISNIVSIFNDRYKLKLTPANLFEYKILDEFIKFLLKSYKKNFHSYYIFNKNNSHINDFSEINSEKIASEENFEDIAIIGMAGIFPNATDVDSLWKNLIHGNDAIKETPASRWDWSAYNNTALKWGGFVEGVDEFDAEFFNISPKEAILMDPQQRLLLQTVWTTVEDAGYSSTQLKSKKIGVFVGVSSNDYAEILQKMDLIDGHTTTGLANSIIPNRISYFLDFNGPSEVIDTACSSSLVAIHHAIHSIWMDNCEMAIAAGVNLLLSPTLSLAASEAGMLSKDGRCKTFDAKANGYVRGEGAAAILLKPMHKALSDGDKIYGIIKGSAVNHGGHVNSLSVPNPNAQAELLVAAYQKAGIDLNTISYIETHGTGTSLGDPIEFNGLKKAFNMLADLNGVTLKEKSCALGTIKANIGHLEAAAGIAGVIKVLLMLKHKKIPMQLHFEQINPYIELENTPFYILKESQDWKSVLARRAGISSFGFGGTNAHIVIEEFSQHYDQSSTVDDNSESYYIFTLSAKTLIAFNELIKIYQKYLDHQEFIAMSDFTYTANTGRCLFKYRLALVFKNIAQLKAALHNGEYLKGEASHDKAYFLKDDELCLNSNKLSYKRFLEKLAGYYVEGFNIDWHKFYSTSNYKKISLPTYPFQKESYWAKELTKVKEQPNNKDIYRNFYQESWRKKAIIFETSQSSEEQKLEIQNCIYLVLGNLDNLSLALQEELAGRRASVILIETSSSFEKINDTYYKINVLNKLEFNKILDLLSEILEDKIINIIYLLGLEKLNSLCEVQLLENYQKKICGGLLYITQELFIKKHLNFSKLWVVTQGVYKIVEHENVNPFAATLWGMCKSIRQEYPQLKCYSLDLDLQHDNEKCINFLLNEFKNQDSEIQVAFRQDERFVLRLINFDKDTFLNQPHQKFLFNNYSAYLITGGTGGVGLKVAAWLLSQGAKYIVLVSRNKPSIEVQEVINKLNNQDGKILVLQADISDRSQVKLLLENLGQNKNIPPLKGIFHAAVALADKMIFNHDWDSYEGAFKAKIYGAWNLHCLTINYPLDHFVLFSSIGALLGQIGASNYVAANTFLDALAFYRQTLGLPAQSINWGEWENVGLAKQYSETRERLGVGALTQEEIKEALTKIFSFPMAQVAVCKINWLLYKQKTYYSTLYLEVLEEYVKENEHVSLENTFLSTLFHIDINECLTFLKNHLVAILRRALQLNEIKPINETQGFAEMGIDSLLALEVQSQLQTDIGDIFPLPPTLLYEKINVVQLASYLEEKLQPFITAGKTRVKEANKIEHVADNTKNHSDNENELIAIVGMGCRFPGGGESIEEFWSLLKEEKDCVIEIPPNRWNIEQYYDANVDLPGKMYVKHAAFLESSIEEFDPQFFGISPREAVLMDPQQRLLLEIVWQSLENAAIVPSSLKGKNIAVYVGVATQEYLDLLNSHSVDKNYDIYIGTGNNHSATAGRISYHFGFNGPNLSINTACSSSLVAVHLACQNLRYYESEVAIAAGVNVILSPDAMVQYCKMKMLSPEGLCKTFDATADGFVRGEGCGAVVLKRLSDAKRDNDKIYAIIRGSSVNQDGASSGLTVPNITAQKALVKDALRSAKLEANAVSYVEAHGTGTALGDPIELHAIANVYGENRRLDQPLTVGSVKTNIGHLEAAAGIAGLIKTVLALNYQTIPAHLHFEKLNPKVQISGFNIHIPQKSISWKNQVRIAAVSSFGFSGTNAHVILQEAQGITNKISEQYEEFYFIGLSAKTDAALIQKVNDLERWLNKAEFTSTIEASATIENISYTLNAGREHFEKRYSIVVSSILELKEALRKIIKKEPILNGFSLTSYGNSLDDNIENQFKELTENLEKIQFLTKIQKKNVLFSLAKCYVIGYQPNWEFLYLNKNYEKILLPTYPFIRQNYWPEELRNITSQKKLTFATNSILSQDISLFDNENDLMQWLQEKISAALQLTDMNFSSEKNFLDLGMDSLVAIEIKNVIQDLLGEKFIISNTVVLDYPNLLLLTGYLKPHFINNKQNFNKSIEINPIYNQCEFIDSVFKSSLPLKEINQKLNKLRAESIYTAKMEEIIPAYVLLDKLCYYYIVNALYELGWKPNVGEIITVDEIIFQGKIHNKFQKLVTHFFKILASENILILPNDSDTYNKWKVGRLPPDAASLFTQIINLTDQIKRIYPDSIELLLVIQAGNQLAGLLKAEQSILPILFPNDQTNASAYKLYTEPPLVKLSNYLLEQGLILALDPMKKNIFRSVRILEIGAGTGSSTQYVLSAFKKMGISFNYTFTDVSTVFLIRAKEKFKAYDMLEYKLLNIEQDSKKQDIPLAYYDIVIAANVLHVTQDITQTLRNVRDFLTPKGVVFLIEESHASRWINLTFGLLEGWWRFQDFAIRSDYPLMNKETWLNLFNISKFSNSFAIGEEQILIVGQLSDQIKNDEGGEPTFLENAHNTLLNQEFLAKASAIQESLWFLQQKLENKAVYNVPMTFKITGNLDKNRVEKIFNLFINEHEILRTYFKLSNSGEVMQCIAPEFYFQTEGLNKDISYNMEEYIIHEINKPFDLTKLPLFRVKIIDINSTESVLIIITHHIIIDGISLSLLMQRFSNMYNGLEKYESQLPKNSNIQYKEYVKQQNIWLKTESAKKQISFWKNQFNTPPEMLALPYSNERENNKQTDGNYYFEISSSLTEELQQLCKKETTTLFVFLLSVYYVLLYRYTQQTDLIIGTPVSNRNKSEISNLIGCLINTVALRININEDLSFSDFLREIRSKFYLVLQYSDLPYEYVIKNIDLNRKDSFSDPLLQIYFLFYTDTYKLSLQDCQIEQLKIRQPSHMFDLTLEIIKHSEHISARIEYNIDLFTQKTIERFRENFKELLIAIIANPQKKISELQVLANEEQEKIKSWNATKSYTTINTIHKIFEEQVKNIPNNIAVVFNKTALTYEALNIRANQLANYLRKEHQVKANELIALFLDRSEFMIIGMLAVLKAGAAYLPIDITYPQDRISFILQNANARIVLSEEKYKLNFLTRNNIYVYAINKSSFIKKTELLSSKNPITSVKNTDYMYAIYTSGTTGKPKGVLQTHFNITRLFNATKNIYNFNSNDVWASFHSYAFDVSVWEIWGALTHSGKLVIPTAEQATDIMQFYDLCCLHKFTVLNQTPTAFYQFIDHAVENKHKKLKSIKYIILAGEALNYSKLRDWYDIYSNEEVQLVNMYGITETSVFSTYKIIKKIDAYRDSAKGSIGIAIPDVALYVLDKNLKHLPIGVIGELYIGGFGLSPGYLNNENLTNEKFFQNPFQTQEEKARHENSFLYKTGDLVRYLLNGEIEYICRNDFQVKIKGYRIELKEIENILQEYPGVKQCVVVSTDQKHKNNQYLIGYYVANEILNEDHVKEFLAEKLPNYMLLSVLVPLKSLPLTINGKLDKHALPKPVFTQEISYKVPENQLELQLCDIWSEVLGVPKGQVGVRDDFFKLGGDSIVSIQLVSKIRQILKSQISVKDIFNFKTIENLSKYIYKKQTEIGKLYHVQQIEKKTIEKFPLLPIQSWFFNEKFLMPHHWNQSFIIQTPSLDISRLRQSLREVISHHNYFNFRYKKYGNNVLQYYSNATRSEELKVLNIKTLCAEENSESFAEKLNRIYTDWQSGFDLEKGPLYAIGYVYGYDDTSARIFVSFHHLISDVISWRIFLEDLQTVYSRKNLNPKTSDYRQWCNVIEKYAEANKEEKKYWKKVLSDYVDNYPHSDPRLYHYIDFSLTVDETQLFLKNKSKNKYVYITDILLSALSNALVTITEKTINHVLLEGHGREEITNIVDITRTIGWFTSLYPVRLVAFDDIALTLESLKENFEQIPNNGIGYGPLFGYDKNILPRIIFNYIGQIEPGISDLKMWKIVHEDSGTSTHPENISSFILNINSAVFNERLQFRIYSQLERTITQSFCKKFNVELKNTINYITNKSRSFLMTSDIENIISESYLSKLQVDKDLDKIYLANSLQQGFIVSNLRQHKKGDAYIVQMLWLYDCSVDVGRLNQAWLYACQKYSALRLKFSWDEEMVQCITNEEQLDWRYIDLSSENDDIQVNKLKLIQEIDRSEPYDLTQGKLFRVYLIKRNENKYNCLISIHHSILDGWSYPILLNYIHDTYLRLLNGKTVFVTPDVGYEQAQSYSQKIRRFDEVYWKKYISEVTEFLDINLFARSEYVRKNPGNIFDTFNFKDISLNIKSEVHIQLKSICHEWGVTLNSLLQYTWHKALSIYGCSTQTIVGTVISGRNLPIDDIEKSVGLFINTLPLVVMHKNFENELLVDVVKKIQADIHEMNQRSAASLGELILNETRLFDSLFIYENYPTFSNEAHKEKLSLKYISYVEKFDYPLVVTVHKIDKELKFILKYSEELFEKERMEQILELIEIILENVIAKPTIKVKELLYLNSESYQKVIYDWNRTNKQYLENETICSLFERQAEKTPDATAIIFENKCLIYSELNERVNQVSHYLQKIGIGSRPDMLVAICVERSVEMVIGVLAVLKVGAAYVPCDPDYPEERLRYMLIDTQVSFLLSQLHLSKKLAALFSDQQIIFLDQENLFSMNATTNPQTKIKVTDLAYVIYTSGSTGQPKGVMITHQNLTNLILAMNKILNMKEGLKFLSMTSICFDIAGLEWYSPLIIGGTIILANQQQVNDDEALITLINTSRSSIIQMTPLRWSMLLDAGWQAKNPVKILVGGEAVNLKLAKKLISQGKVVFNVYGPTETTIWSSYARILSDQPILIGKPIVNTQLYILDNNLNVLPIGAIGELYIGGAGVARGYFNKPELTAERFIISPFVAEEKLYKTGDLVRWHSNGSLEYIGRNDFQIKLRGHRIELGEIENKLSKYPEIKQCVVLLSENDNEDNLVGYYTSEAPQDSQEIRSYLQKSLPAYMIPSKFIQMNVLPLLKNNKLDRVSLLKHEKFLQEKKKYVLPENQQETILQEIWSALLKIPKEKISICDSFFSLGGHSLLSIKLMNEISRQLSVSIEFMDIFNYPTIALLSEFITTRTIIKYSALCIFPIQTKGAGTPLFLVHPGGGVALPYMCFSKLTRPVYGINNPYLGQKKNFKSLKHMVKFYINEIKKIQPCGPYALGGLSFGGVVALEIAQQLRSEDEQVEIVILIDTFNPSGQPRINIDYYDLAKKLISGVNPSLQLGEKFITAISKEIEIEMKWLSLYAPAFYPGLTVLLKATDDETEINIPEFNLWKLSRFLDDSNGWKELLPKLEVYYVPGSHSILLSPQNCINVLNKIQEILNRI